MEQPCLKTPSYKKEKEEKKKKKNIKYTVQHEPHKFVKHYVKQ